MKITLILLSSLALAAASLAAETAKGQSHAQIAYTLGQSMTATLLSETSNRTLPDGTAPTPAGRYVYDFSTGDFRGQSPPKVAEYNTGEPITDPSLYALAFTADATGSQNGNVLTVDSTVDASLAGSPALDIVLSGAYGYRFFLQVTNNGSSPEDVVFDLRSQGSSISGSIDKPYDDATAKGAEVFLATTADVYDITGTVPGNLEFDTYPSNVPSFSFSDSLAGAQRRFTLGAGATAEYQVYAGTRFYLSDLQPAPVPEPAPLAALGLGALAMLRRRRK